MKFNRFLLISLGSLAGLWGGCQKVSPEAGAQPKDLPHKSIQLQEVPVAPRFKPGDLFIWGYYTGAGGPNGISKRPRMYEAYIKLADPSESLDPTPADFPQMALLTLFPDEEPRGQWVLHNGIGYDYDKVISTLGDPLFTGQAPIQMFGWDASTQTWYRSTRTPNTSALEEKFNYRRAVLGPASSLPTYGWTTGFSCYVDGVLEKMDEISGGCRQGDPVFRQEITDKPPYLFLPYYDLQSGITVYKHFNEDSEDPEANVAMRLVFARQAGENTESRNAAVLFHDPLIEHSLEALFKIAESIAYKTVRGRIVQ